MKKVSITMTCPQCKGAKCGWCYRLGWVLIPMLTIKEYLRPCYTSPE